MKKDLNESQTASYNFTLRERRHYKPPELEKKKSNPKYPGSERHWTSSLGHQRSERN